MIFVQFNSFSRKAISLPKLLWCIAAVLLAAIVPARGAALESSVVQSGGLALAKGGQALLPIVVSAQASEETKTVAAELAKYLGQITGAKWEVQAGNGQKGIVLGTLAEFPQPQLSKPLEIRNRYDGKEAYAIRTEANRVLLIGATDLGASHAAYRFLESLGCRWFFPAKEWEVVPSIPSLQVRINGDDRPVILSRRIWYGHGTFDPVSRQAYYDWSRRNRMARSLDVNPGHSWEGIVRRNKAEFDAHPEYFALVKQADGALKRQPPMLEVGNPALRQLVAKDALEYFRKNPDSEMISVGPADGLYKNESPESKAFGKTVSDQIFGLVNEVARAVQKEFPGKMVGILAYSNYTDPPSFALEPNVFIQLTHGFNYGQLSFEELLEEWPKKVKAWGAYEYFSVHISDYDMLPGGAGANVAYIRRQIPLYASLGVLSLSAESSNNWGPNGRGYYLANKLMWDPKADADAILADFYDKAFGPAAAAMKRYYDRFNPSAPGSTRPILTAHLIGLGFRDVDEASRLAKDRPDVQARLEHIKQYLRYAHLYWMLRRERDKAKRRDIMLEIFKHAYRTRYSYLTHWMPTQRGWSVRAAAEFNEPSWSLYSKEPKPWIGTPPYTREETQKAFQEGLKYFQIKTDIEERKFSDDLVPVRFSGDAPPTNKQAYRTAGKYDFYSVRGEPLQMTMTPGWLKTQGLRDVSYFSYVVTDTAGALVVKDRFLSDAKPHSLNIKVPRAGLYHVAFSDVGLGWLIETPPTQPAAIVLQADRGLNSKAREPLFFYVPKGTKQISYAFDGAPHTVSYPDRKLIRRIIADGEMVTIPVPDGADGKVWSFATGLAGELQFTNLPNSLSGSPGLMLLPRELALNDGLEIISK